MPQLLPQNPHPDILPQTLKISFFRKYFLKTLIHHLRHLLRPVIDNSIHLQTHNSLPPLHFTIHMSIEQLGVTFTFFHYSLLIFIPFLPIYPHTLISRHNILPPTLISSNIPPSIPFTHLTLPGFRAPPIFHL